jgi:hypothetical protein
MTIDATPIEILKTQGVLTAADVSPTQRFFAALAASTRAPAYAEIQRNWVNELLKRAQEAGIFTPEAP